MIGCDRPNLARGLCSSHYAQWHRTGKVGGPIDARSHLDLLIEWVTSRDRSTGCWFVDWSATPGGYPTIWYEGSARVVSNVVLILDDRAQPKGQEALHSCDAKPCINPGHLNWGTRSDNMREKWNRLPVRRRTTVPCPTCGRLHRDHQGSVRSAAWYAANTRQVY